MEYDKIQSFAQQIIAECQKQGFKIYDFRALLDALTVALTERVRHLETELL